MGWLKRRIIEELEPTVAEWERRWIPIDEALPDRNVNVLVYIPVSEEKTFIASLDEGGMWFSSDPTADAYSLGEDGAPTHWMPLPAPPTDSK
jgi:hypothetical protein